MPFITQGKTSLKYILIVVILAVIAGGGISAYQYWWVPKEEAKNIQKPVGCTQEAKVCPDGSAVGRTGPNCEFAQCPDVKKDETANWKTYRNEEYGFELKYPENFLSGEPEVMVADCENINFPTECPEAKKIIGHSIPDFWFETKGGKTTINNTPYCFYLWSEGAAGSVYSNYYYTTVKNKKCLTAYFLIISTNCGTFGSPGEEDYEQCKYKNDITKPKILNQILSTFKFLE